MLEVRNSIKTNYFETITITRCLIMFFLLNFVFLTDIARLRKKFDNDKKKIAEMKSARKFRPY